MLNRPSSLVFAITVAFALVCAPAMACPSDSYDRDRELAAIKEALPGAKLNPAEKQEMDKLVRVVSVNRASLTLKGIAMQSDARGKAMQKLGLARIPAKPQKELEAINGKLQGLTSMSDDESQAVRLRDEAEKLWTGGQYDASREALTKALNLLQISLVPFRC